MSLSWGSVDARGSLSLFSLSQIPKFASHHSIIVNYREIFWIYASVSDRFLHCLVFLQL